MAAKSGPRRRPSAGLTVEAAVAAPSGPRGAGNNAEHHEERTETQRSHNAKEAT